MKTKRTLKDWFLVTRPWSFPASMVPVFATAVYMAYRCHVEGMDYSVTNAVISLFMLLSLHAAANLIGDYHDHVRKVDLPGSLNGVHAIYDGIFTAKEVLWYGYVLLAAGGLLGIILLLLTNMSAVWIGVSGMVIAACYPWLKYHRMGDLAVLLGFAVLPSVGVGFAMTGTYVWETSLVSLAFGMLTVAILHANNTRDIANDMRAGISTICIKMGWSTSQKVYALEVFGGYALVPVMVMAGMLPLVSCMVYLTFPLALTNIRQMLAAEPMAEEQIGNLDQRTAQMQLAFGVLYTLSFVIAIFL